MLGWPGPGAFRTIFGAVKSVLMIMPVETPRSDSVLSGIDDAARLPDEKANMLQWGSVVTISTRSNSGIRTLESRCDQCRQESSLSTYAESYQGICTGDYARFGRYFWEILSLLPGWILQQSTVTSTNMYEGRQNVLLWEDGTGELHSFLFRGWERMAWGLVRGLKRGAAPVSPSTKWAVWRVASTAAIALTTSPSYPHDVAMLPALLWAFCSSPQFHEEIRRI